MATNVTGTFYGTNCRMWNHNNGNTYYLDWLQLVVAYDISAASNKAAYNVKIRVRLRTSVRMNWTGVGGDPKHRSILTIKVDDETTKSVGNPVIRLVGEPASGETYYYGDWTGWFSYEYEVGASKSTIDMSVVVDLSKIVGSNSGKEGGPDSNSNPGYHYNRLSASKSVSVEGIVIGKKPALTSLSNNNKYTNPTTGTQNGVSNSTSSVSVKVNVDSWGTPTAKVYWKCGSKSGNTSSSTFTVSGLSAGTSYTVSVYLKNSIGSSSTKTITIRTRYNAPTLTLTLSTRYLEKLKFNWASTRSMASMQYKIDSGSWVDLDQTGTSGSFTAKWFQPNTTHTIYIKGRSTATYDSLNASQVSESGETYDISHITNISTIIFGKSFTVGITGETASTMSLRMWTQGNGRIAEVTVTPSRTTNTITFTQSQLDSIYKTFPKANSTTMYFRLTTIGENDEYADGDTVRTIGLTGIARTAHVGVSNVPKRADVYIGINGVPKRCVTWIGDANGIARRCI